jgi:RHS repeat-associated protein
MPPFLTFYYLCHINPLKIMELLNYFYHPDHASTWLNTSLGSSASTGLSNLWITDNTGWPIQHLHYLPFGEDWVDQRNSNWNVPYTFSGKEKDVETGYGYFGARYYDSGLSIWLSVDPMSDKYPNMSPYNYCANNPVILVDPDGRYPWPVLLKHNNGTRTIISGMYRNQSGKFHGAVDIVHKSSSGNISGGSVYATHGGKVTQSGNSTTAGNWIQITNGDIRTTYMHLENLPTQKIGEDVTELTKLGTVGNTGRSEGPHLHYQIEMFNTETQKWEKTNPVVGDPDKVDKNDDVNLYDPQKYIDFREGNAPGTRSENAIRLDECEIIAPSKTEPIN